ncbi:glycosyltransferase family 4 protein [Actinoplanes sp. NPDC026619]|uniref:glycosyltransferase family 4 protein n=1 Tax=Actinoplanes sp. NPDC026619 TaxID=3155798 RepID=UPI0033D1178B
MRIVLAQNMPHVPTYGGANRSNRIMLEHLAARGHDCTVVAPMHVTRAELDRRLAGYAVDDARVDGDTVSFELNGVRVRAVLVPQRLVREVRRCVAAVGPDRVLVPSDDPGAMMLGASLVAAPDRVVYLAHTVQQLPFGPASFHPSPAATRLVHRCAAVVAVSRTVQDHLRRWGGLDSALMYPAVYGDGPYPLAEGDAVTMVNPCAYKGIEIFLGLADAFPHVPFLAVPTWGTTGADLGSLRQRPNIELMAATDDIGRVFARTRVLAMPSLWDETFGYTAVEAMLRGVPVLAARIGGLPEAMLGVPHLLPVTRISRYDDDGGRPVPEVPAQDLEPWIRTLSRVLTDDAHRGELRRSARQAAGDFVASLDPDALENLLRREAATTR